MLEIHIHKKAFLAKYTPSFSFRSYKINVNSSTTEVMKGHDLPSKAKDWFLYDRDDRHEKVN